MSSRDNRMDKTKVLPALKIACKVILPLWQVLKIAAVLITYLTQGEVDLAFLNPGVELGFQSLVFIKDTSMGLAVFIGFVVITTLGFPMSFLVVPDGRVRNIIGFFAYAIVLLTDVVAAIVLGIKDGIYFLSLFLCLIMIAVLLFYGKTYLLRGSDPDDDEIPDGEDDKINLDNENPM